VSRFNDFKTSVHLVGFLFIVVIADAQNHEPETHFTARRVSLISFFKSHYRPGQALTVRGG
jgi:pterin-4a-carbinolamine dehydratase